MSQGASEEDQRASLETLGIKSDQSRGIDDPGVVQTAKVSDDNRISRLAQHIIATASSTYSYPRLTEAA